MSYCITCGTKLKERHLLLQRFDSETGDQAFKLEKFCPKAQKEPWYKRWFVVHLIEPETDPGEWC